MEPATERSIIEQLVDAVGDLDKRQAQLKRALTGFKKGDTDDPCRAYLWIKANKDLIEKEAPTLLEMVAEIETLCRDKILRFESDLRDAVTAAGLTFSGQWPKYYVEYIVPVVIDESKYKLSVGEEKLQTFAVETVMANLKAQLKRLKVDQSKLSDFLREMYESYVKLSSSQGSTIPIWDLYREMVIDRQPRKLWRDATSANFRSFTEAEFRAHLTELLKMNLTTISSRQLRLLPPIAKDESLFIYQPSENRFAHVGRVQFILSAGE